MADTLAFELVSPERLLLSEPVEMVVVPGAEGDFGALAGHSPMISTLRIGVITLYAGGQPTRRIFVSGGFAEVTPERCTVLADEAVMLADADRAEAVRRVAAAERALADAELEPQRAAAQRALAVAGALVAAIGGQSGH